MKYTETQILEKTKKILKDLKQEFYREDNLRKVVFAKKDELARPRGKIIDTWTAVIDAPFDTSEFLIISDETGEPLYIQGKHSIYEISKDDKGNYY
jgi:hypothetical protein